MSLFLFDLSLLTAFRSVVTQIDLLCNLDQFIFDSDKEFFFSRHWAVLQSFEILRKPKFQKRRGAGRRQNDCPAQVLSVFWRSCIFLFVGN